MYTPLDPGLAGNWNGWRTGHAQGYVKALNRPGFTKFGLQSVLLKIFCDRMMNGFIGGDGVLWVLKRRKVVWSNFGTQYLHDHFT